MLNNEHYCDIPRLAMSARRLRTMPQVLVHLPLKMQTGKLTVAGVVNEMMVDEMVDEMICDTISVADEGCTDPSTSQQAITVKVFHGDGINYPDGGIPRKGDVLILKDMTVSVCVCVCVCVCVNQILNH